MTRASLHPTPVGIKPTARESSRPPGGKRFKVCSSAWRMAALSFQAFYTPDFLALKSGQLGHFPVFGRGLSFSVGLGQVRQHLAQAHRPFVGERLRSRMLLLRRQSVRREQALPAN